MAIDVKPILRAGVAAQAAALALRNAELLKKKKKKSKDFLRAGADTFIGTAFISAESNLIGSI